MENKNNEGELTRRNVINQGLIAGLALTAGLLGLSSPSYAQTEDPELKVKNIKVPSKVNFKELVLEKANYSPLNLNDQFDILHRSTEVLKQVSNQVKNGSQSQLPAIESNIKLPASFSDDFLKNNIEELLDQAANLLDRGMKDRDEWDNLSIRAFYLEMEINQFLDLDKIHIEETKNGYYDQLLDEKLSQLNIENLTRSKLEQIANVFAQMFEKRWNDKEMSNYIKNKSEIARNAGGSARDSASSEIEKSLTLATEEYDMAVQYVYNIVQKEGLLTSKDQSKFREKLLKKQVKWETVDRDFRMMRTDIERKYEYVRLLAFNAEDGVLNLRKRKDPLAARFLNDFQEAYSRLKTASIGLKEMYGYDHKLPEDPQSIDFFDRCVLWNRHAINWLIRFSNLDQSFVLPISVRSLVMSGQDDDNKWNSLLSGNLQFSILEDKFFKEYSNVRLKGITLYSQVKNRKKSKTDYVAFYEGMLQSEIQAPANSYYRLSDNTQSPVKQTHLPIIKFNRIASKGFIREPDVVGSSLFNNISPIGDWNLRFPQVNSEALLSKVDIEDIFLELYITARRSSR